MCAFIDEKTEVYTFRLVGWSHPKASEFSAGSLAGQVTGPRRAELETPPGATPTGAVRANGQQSWAPEQPQWL